MKVENAVNKLNQLFPLKKRQDLLDGDSLKVHRTILYSFVEKGRPPTINEISELLNGKDETDVLWELSLQDLIVINDSFEPLGAYPMTIEETNYNVTVNGHKIKAMCALDALGISPMFGYEVEIETKCYVTGEPIKIKQFNKEIKEVNPTPDIYFGIKWNSPTFHCADSLCTNMVFLKDKDTAQNWQKEQVRSREIFTLGEALDFSEAFFVPLVKD